MQEELVREFILPRDEASKLEPHPYCLWLPTLSATAYEELVDSVRDGGLLEPIVLLDNRVLDGRHRLKACLETETVPRFRKYDGNAEAVIDWVLAKNLFRRHLNDDQALAVATKANAERIQLQAAEQQKQAGKQGGKQGGRGHRKTLTQKSGQGFPATNRHTRSTAGQIAEQAHTSRYKAEQALKIQKQDPALLDQVINGQLSFNDAVKQSPKREVRHRKASKEKKPAWKLATQIERCQNYLGRIIRDAPSGAGAEFVKQLQTWLAEQGRK